MTNAPDLAYAGNCPHAARTSAATRGGVARRGSSTAHPGPGAWTDEILTRARPYDQVITGIIALARTGELTGGDGDPPDPLTGMLWSALVTATLCWDLLTSELGHAAAHLAACPGNYPADPGWRTGGLS